MEQSPKTSFIPKQGNAGAAIRQRRSLNVVTFVAMVTFLAVLMLSAGVFFYQQYTVQKLDEKKKQLADLRGGFSEADIESIRMLEKRLKTAEALLDQHISLSKVFDALEDRTQEQTQLSNFSFERLPSGKAQISLSGISNSFNTLALQKRAYAGEKSFVQGSVLFSNLSVSGEDEDRVVTFEVTGDLSASAIAYTADVSVATTTSVPTQIASSSEDMNTLPVSGLAVPLESATSTNTP